MKEEVQKNGLSETLPAGRRGQKKKIWRNGSAIEVTEVLRRRSDWTDQKTIVKTLISKHLAYFRKKFRVMDGNLEKKKRKRVASRN